MKRFAALLMTLCMGLFVMTSCAEVNYQMTVNKNDSVNLEATLSLDNESYEDFGSFYLQAFISALEKDGFTVTQEEKNGKHEICASLLIDDVNQLSESNFMDVLPVTSYDYGVNRSLFYNKYALDLNLDMTNFVSDLKLDESAKQAMLDELEAKSDENGTDDAGASDNTGYDDTDTGTDDGTWTDSTDTSTDGKPLKQMARKQPIRIWKSLPKNSAHFCRSSRIFRQAISV